MQQEMGYEEPRFAKWLFASPAAGLIWLVVRVYIGYEWLHAGWGKVTGTEGEHLDLALRVHARVVAPDGGAAAGLHEVRALRSGAGSELLGQLRVVRLVPAVDR